MQIQINIAVRDLKRRAQTPPHYHRAFARRLWRLRFNGRFQFRQRLMRNSLGNLIPKAQKIVHGDLFRVFTGRCLS